MKKKWSFNKKILLIILSALLVLTTFAVPLRTEAATTLKKSTVKSVKVLVSGLRVTWKKSAKATGYRIYRSVNGGKFKKIKTVKKNTTVKYTDTTVKNGKTYRYQIKAYRTKNGTTDVSKAAESKAVIYLTAPEITGAEQTGGSVNVSWTRNKKSTGYEIRYAINGKRTIIKTTDTSLEFLVPAQLESEECLISLRSYRQDNEITSYSPWAKTTIQIRAPDPEPEDTEPQETGFDPASIPEFSGTTVLTVNFDEPYFTDEQKIYNGTFIQLSELDTLGRCGPAFACVGLETKPEDDREDISSVYPTGWIQRKLSNGTYLFNRSHLLMFALTGLNDDNRNLITGTRQFNASNGDGMLGWETTVKQAVEKFNAHVVYRVTPVFEGNNLLAKGVLMEAYCIEYPEECTFCRFIYNVQKGVVLDYATGESYEENPEPDPDPEEPITVTYVLNINTKKFHTTDCRYAISMSEESRQETDKTREELIEEGYDPCGTCKP